MTSAPPPQVKPDSFLPTDDDAWEDKPGKKKRRPGLSKGLVPGQKVLKMYKEQKIKDNIVKKL